MLLFKPNLKKLKENRKYKSIAKLINYKKDKEIKDKATKLIKEFLIESHPDFFNSINKLLLSSSDNELISEILLLIFHYNSSPLLYKSIKKHLNNSNKRVKELAIRALGTTKINEAYDELVHFLQEDDFVGCASESLGKLGDERAIQPLIESFKKQRHFATIDALGMIGSKNSVTFLLELLSKKEFLLHVVPALGRIKDNRAVDSLIKLLDYIVESITIGDMLSNRYYDKNIDLYEKILYALGSIGDKRAVDTLIKIKEKYNGRESHVCRVLGELGDNKAIETLLKDRQFDPLIRLGWRPQISKGMTKQQVINILGKPKSTGPVADLFYSGPKRFSFTYSDRLSIIFIGEIVDEVLILND